VLGTLLLVAATPRAGIAFVACQVASAVVAVVLVGALGRTVSHRREERLISALAIVGRSSVAAVFLQVSAAEPEVAATCVVAVTVLSLVLAGEMLRLGPRQRRVIETDPRLTSKEADSAATGSSSSALRGLRDPANDVTASCLLRPEPSIRQ
jgi:endonuclease/exonuclease/phosphatase (EEP) superfamily protein YafD